MAMIQVDWKPGEQQLRGFGLAGVVAFGALGAWVLWRHSIVGIGLGPETARNATVVLWGLALVCGVLRWIAPAWLRPLYVGLVAMTLPIGFVMSHFVVGIVYFGVVTPIAVIFRVMGRDPLQRTVDREAATYWVRRNPTVDLARYYRQF
jgi:hypothetical protein